MAADDGIRYSAPLLEFWVGLGCERRIARVWKQSLCKILLKSFNQKPEQGECRPVDECAFRGWRDVCASVELACMMMLQWWGLLSETGPATDPILQQLLVPDQVRDLHPEVKDCTVFCVSLMKVYDSRIWNTVPIYQYPL